MSARRIAPREHVVLLDRVGHARYYDADGRPFLNPERYELTLITPLAKLGSVLPHEAQLVIGSDLDPASMLGMLREVSRNRPVDHILAISERLLLPAAHLRADLGVGGPQPALMTTLRDKLAMKQRVAAAGVRVPEFTAITRAADATPLLRRHDAVIVKPTSGMGSQGVHVARTPGDLAALDRLPSMLQGPYEAEEFVAGDLVHVDSMVVAGRATAVTMCRYLDPTTAFGDNRPFRSVEVPAGATRRELSEFNDRVLAAYPEFSGASHLEVFRRPDGEIVFCEIAGRPGGAGVIPTFRHHYGVDLYEAALIGQLDPGSMPAPLVDPATGAPVVGPPPEAAVTGWVGLYGGPGELLDVSTPDAGWIVEAKQRKRLGDRIGAPTMSGDAVVFVTVAGPDADTVTARLDEVVARSVIRVRGAEERARPAAPRRG